MAVSNRTCLIMTGEILFTPAVFNLQDPRGSQHRFARRAILHILHIIRNLFHSKTLRVANKKIHLVLGCGVTPSLISISLFEIKDMQLS
jgi:hypothetical protein